MILKKKHCNWTVLLKRIDALIKIVFLKEKFYYQLQAGFHINHKQLLQKIKVHWIQTTSSSNWFPTAEQLEKN